MTIEIEPYQRYSFTGNSNKAFFSRLGGVAGLLVVALSLVQAFTLAVPDFVAARILHIAPNLVVVIWFVCIYAVQSPHLGRLGSLGLGAATTGLAAITIFNLIQGNTIANETSWVSALLASPLLPVILTALAVVFVWGVLALGTTSLKAGILPRGAVVLWMVGLMSILITSWPPILLIGLSGIVWSSLILLRGEYPKVTLSLPDKNAFVSKASGAGRLIPLDALRGIIMILMAIDHASYYMRRWHPFETWDQPLPDYPSLAAMLTRLATHPCAPGFFFLMGAGMILFALSRRRFGWSERKIAGRLALRGLLFIVLEQLVVDVASAGQVNPFEFSILSCLGVVMILGALLLRLTGSLQVIAGAAILMLMQFLPGILLNIDLGVFDPIRLLFLPGAVGPVYVLYPPIPWLGVALLGMAFARLLVQNQEKAYRLAAVAGLACLAAFPLLRVLSSFGNLRMPPGNTVIDFFNLVKYPPSLSFLCLALGFDLIVLYLLSRISSSLARWGQPVVILGKAALYFFLVHWFVYGAMGLVWHAPDALPQTYLAWFIGLLLIYPVCKTFEAFKHRMAENSIWRML